MHATVSPATIGQEAPAGLIALPSPTLQDLTTELTHATAITDITGIMALVGSTVQDLRTPLELTTALIPVTVLPTTSGQEVPAGGIALGFQTLQAATMARTPATVTQDSTGIRHRMCARSTALLLSSPTV